MVLALLVAGRLCLASFQDLRSSRPSTMSSRIAPGLEHSAADCVEMPLGYSLVLVSMLAFAGVEESSYRFAAQSAAFAEKIEELILAQLDSSTEESIWESFLLFWASSARIAASFAARKQVLLALDFLAGCRPEG